MAATNKIIPINNIIIKKGFNSRFIFNQEKMRELERSILSKGLVYPITVKSIKLTNENISNYEIWQEGSKQNIPKAMMEKDIYVLIDGERRLRCHQTLIEKDYPIKGIKASIESNAIKDDDALVTSYLKNTGENFTPLEEANLFKKLIDVYNWTMEDVSNSTGKSVGTIKSRLNLLNSSGKPLQQAINDKTVTLGTAEEIIKQCDSNLEKQNELLDKEMKNSTISTAKKAEKEAKLKAKYNNFSEVEEITQNKSESEQIDPLDADEDSTPEEKDMETKPVTVEDNTPYVPITIEFPNKKVLDFQEWKEDYDNLLADIKESIENKENKNYLSYLYGSICKLAEILDLDVEDDLSQDNVDICENLMCTELKRID